MAEKYLLTEKGLKFWQERIAELEEKLKNLQSQTAHAAEVGGNQYHDNASYEMLVIDIRGIDRQLSDACMIVNNAILTAPAANANKVAIGTIVLVDVNGIEREWDIVGFGESDPDNGKLAYNTPLGDLIMGCEAGEIISGGIGGRKADIRVKRIRLPKEE